MSLQYIRDYYGVPANRGGRITFTGTADKLPQQGTITGADNVRLRVRFDGQKHTAIVHPTWEVAYAAKTQPVLETS